MVFRSIRDKVILTHWQGALYGPYNALPQILGDIIEKKAIHAKTTL